MRLIASVFVLAAAAAAGAAAHTHTAGVGMKVRATFTNVGQPWDNWLTPLLVGVGSKPALVGGKASAGLEDLAETGATAALAGEWRAAGAATQVTTLKGINDVILPGESVSVDLTVFGDAPTVLVAAMVLPSNDAFVFGEAAVNGGVARITTIYDAGTEENDEADATTPPLSMTGGAEGTATADGRITVHAGYNAPGSPPGGVRFSNAALRRSTPLLEVRFEALNGTCSLASTSSRRSGGRKHHDDDDDDDDDDNSSSSDDDDDDDDDDAHHVTAKAHVSYHKVRKGWAVDDDDDNHDDDDDDDSDFDDDDDSGFDDDDDSSDDDDDDDDDNRHHGRHGHGHGDDDDDDDDDDGSDDDDDAHNFLHDVLESAKHPIEKQTLFVQPRVMAKMEEIRAKHPSQLTAAERAMMMARTIVTDAWAKAQKAVHMGDLHALETQHALLAAKCETITVKKVAGACWRHVDHVFAHAVHVIQHDADDDDDDDDDSSSSSDDDDDDDDSSS